MKIYMKMKYLSFFLMSLNFYIDITKSYSKIEMVQYPLLSPSYLIGKEKGRGKQLRKSVSQ